MVQLKVKTSIDRQDAVRNLVRHNIEDIDEHTVYVKIGKSVYKSVCSNSVASGEIAVNTPVRNQNRLCVGDVIDVNVVSILKNDAESLKINIKPLVKSSYTLLCKEGVHDSLIEYFKDYYLSAGQSLLYDNNDTMYQLDIVEGDGYLSQSSNIDIRSPDFSVKLISNSTKNVGQILNDCIKKVRESENNIKTETVTNSSTVTVRTRNKICYNNIMQHLEICDTKPNLILVHGNHRTGKTTILTDVANNAKVSYCEFIGASNVANTNREELITHIKTSFKTARSHQFSLIIFDDIEIILNYSDLGSINFTKKMYQLLMANIKTPSDDTSHKMSIIVVCQNKTLKDHLAPYFTHIVETSDSSAV